MIILMYKKGLSIATKLYNVIFLTIGRNFYIYKK